MNYNQVVQNPRKEIQVKRTLEEVQAGIVDVANLIANYTLLEADNITNRYLILISEQDAVSQLTLDMGQHLEIILISANESTTNIMIEIRRAVGVINQVHEVNRANRSISEFITILGRALDGRLQELVDAQTEMQYMAEKKGKKMRGYLWVLIILLITFFVYKIVQIRNWNHAQAETTKSQILYSYNDCRF